MIDDHGWNKDAVQHFESEMSKQKVRKLKHRKTSLQSSDIFI